MKKLSLIKETHWGGMVRRSDSKKEVRKEDEIGNLRYYFYRCWMWCSLGG